MKKRLLFRLFYLCLFCVSCTREVSVQVAGPVAEEGQLSGQVILPQNTKVDTSGLVVLSAIGKSIPLGSRFAIDTIGKVSATVLNNGYNYPGQTDHSISSESTGLALLMNTLTLRSLFMAGKLEIIGKIKANAVYKELVNQISRGVQSGRALTDTTNADNAERIASSKRNSVARQLSKQMSSSKRSKYLGLRKSRNRN